MMAGPLFSLFIFSLITDFLKKFHQVMYMKATKLSQRDLFFVDNVAANAG